MQLAEHRLLAAELSGGISSSAIYRAVLAAGKSAFPDPASVLDFGSGTGQLLPFLQQTFPNGSLHGIDLMPRPANIPAEVHWHQADLNQTVPTLAQQFDLIFAVEVIEHLENAREMVRQLHRLLASGGAAIVSTPNIASFRSLLTFIVRGHHAQFDDSNYPAHISPVGEIDLRRICDETGFTLERLFYTDRGTIPRLLSWYWQDLPLIGNRLLGRRFSDNYGAILRKP